MVKVRKLRWVALALAPLMLVTIVGCHGSLTPSVVLNWLFGSWDGGDVQMQTPCGMDAFLLLFVTLALIAWVSPGEVDTADASGEAEFRANLDYDGDGHSDGPIHFTGNFQQDGNEVTVNLAPVTPADSDLDSITLDLTTAPNQTLSGTITYLQGGAEFTGDVNFQKFPDQ